jgi:putative exporter of polyketide antibiotics
VFASLSFCIGGLLGRKGIAGIVAGFLAFTLFLINSLATTATVLKNINNFSPFKYYNDPGILQHGVDGGSILVLSSAIVFLAILGWVGFIRRDVYQK